MATTDQKTALPASVTVLFPRTDDGAPADTPTAYEIHIDTAAPPGLADDPAGFDGTRVLRSGVVATWSGGSSATNDAELQALAERIAHDWYAWQMAPLDAVYHGPAIWEPDGGHDLIFDHGAGTFQTRVCRGPWLDHLDQAGFLTPANSTVNVKGGTTAITSFAASTIDFDATYTTITNSPTGEANVELQVASATTGGVLTNTSQTIAGAKVFTNGAIFGDDIAISAEDVAPIYKPVTINALGEALTIELYDDVPTRHGYLQFYYDSSIAKSILRLIGDVGVDVAFGITDSIGFWVGASGTDPIGNKFAGGICTSISTTVGASGTDSIGNIFYKGLCTTVGSGSGGGTGDMSGPSSSVDGEIALFDGATGKVLKRAAGSGGVEATSGVYSTYTLTAAGKALLDDASASDQRTTLGLGSLATLSSVTTTEIAAATLVTESDGIASNDNDTTLPTSAAVKDYVDDAVAAGTGAPAGAIVMYGGSDTPTGWLRCDGSAVSRTTYAALFAVIGTTWGAGDGSTSFNVPNFAGRSPIGQGTGTGLTNRVQGTTGGTETHTLTTAQIPSHTHGPPAGESWDGFWCYDDTGTKTLAGGTVYSGASRGATGATGSGEAHNNMAPWLAISFLIKT